MKTRYIALALACLTGLLSACKQEPLNWSGVITFQNPAPESVPADGYTTLTLSAHISPGADADKRAITFTTDFGTFTNGTATITLTADQNGNAVTYLKGTVINTATVRATVQTSYIATKTVNFTAPDPNTLFTISPVTGNVPADGVSTIAIGATINKKLLLTPQSIVFTTDGGLFSNNTATITQAADLNGNITAYLHSSTAATVHVSLAAYGVTQVLPLTFVKALPDTVLLSGAASLSSGFNNTLPLTIALKRTIGVPSPGFYFNYTATDDSGNAVGIFTSGTASDATGAASVTFTMGSSVYKGIVHLTVSLQQSPMIKATKDITVN